jgi:FMN phosphatase YigB (HAD superfamily)
MVFLDDIGENLKAARKAGMRTIKVNLGRSREAVKELEKITGMKLSGDVEKRTYRHVIGRLDLHYEIPRRGRYLYLILRFYRPSPTS